MTNTALKLQIETQINAATAPDSITQVIVGNNLKAVVDYTDQEKRPYKSYVALISQTSINAPTVTILENGLLNITWAYLSNGSYEGTVTTSTFISGKTAAFIGSYASLNTQVLVRPINALAVRIDTYISGTAANTVLNNFPIEIRVYD